MKLILFLAEESSSYSLSFTEIVGWIALVGIIGYLVAWVMGIWVGAESAATKARCEEQRKKMASFLG